MEIAKNLSPLLTVSMSVPTLNLSSSPSTAAYIAVSWIERKQEHMNKCVSE